LTNADRIEEDGRRDYPASAGAANGTTTATGCTFHVAGWAAHGFVRSPPRLAAKTALALPQQASPSTAAASVGKVDGTPGGEEDGTTTAKCNGNGRLGGQSVVVVAEIVVVVVRHPP